MSLEVAKATRRRGSTSRPLVTLEVPPNDPLFAVTTPQMALKANAQTATWKMPHRA